MFVSDSKKRKAFDRTSHKLCSSWPDLSRKHKRLFLIATMSVIIGALVFALLFGDTPMTGNTAVPTDRILWALMGGGIPFVVLVPLSIISYKNHVYACCSEAVCRYHDSLEFQDKQAVYRYHGRRGGSFAGIFEHTICYDLIEKIVCDERRNLLVVTAGGIDTEFRRNGNVERRINFLTGHGCVNPYARTVTIPMVYSDNQALLATFEKYSPVPIQYSDTDEAIVDTERE